jgi:hypothetical protein
MSPTHRPNGSVEASWCRFPNTNAGDDLPEELRAIPVGVDCPDRPAVLLEAINMLLDQGDDP